MFTDPHNERTRSHPGLSADAAAWRCSATLGTLHASSLSIYRRQAAQHGSRNIIQRPSGAWQLKPLRILLNFRQILPPAIHRNRHKLTTTNLGRHVGPFTYSAAFPSLSSEAKVHRKEFAVADRQGATMRAFTSLAMALTKRQGLHDHRSEYWSRKASGRHAVLEECQGVRPCQIPGEG